MEQYSKQVNGCWIWTGWFNGSGYGRKQVLGKKYFAHRLMYERYVKAIPKGNQVDHLCHNKACVNPNHLEDVTPKENRRRAALRRIENHPLCPNGHAYAGTNLLKGKDSKRNKSWRVCRICHLASNRRWRVSNSHQGEWTAGSIPGRNPRREIR